jgi:hypothetical protein
MTAATVAAPQAVLAAKMAKGFVNENPQLMGTLKNTAKKVAKAAAPELTGTLRNYARANPAEVAAMKSGVKGLMNTAKKGLISSGIMNKAKAAIAAAAVPTAVAATIPTATPVTAPAVAAIPTATPLATPVAVPTASSSAAAQKLAALSAQDKSGAFAVASTLINSQDDAKSEIIQNAIRSIVEGAKQVKNTARNKALLDGLRSLSADVKALQGTPSKYSRYEILRVINGYFRPEGFVQMEKLANPDYRQAVAYILAATSEELVGNQKFLPGAINMFAAALMNSFQKNLLLGGKRKTRRNVQRKRRNTRRRR